jgi:hypothetical protein
MAKKAEKPRKLVVKSCEKCPCRLSKDSCGIDGPDWWYECFITREVIDEIGGMAWSKAGKKFPPSCPLK